MVTVVISATMSHTPPRLFLAFTYRKAPPNPGKMAKPEMLGLLEAGGLVRSWRLSEVYCAVSHLRPPCVPCAHRFLSPACQPVSTKPGSLWKKLMQSFPRKEIPGLLRCSQGSARVSPQGLPGCEDVGLTVALRPPGDSHPGGEATEGVFRGCHRA